MTSWAGASLRLTSYWKFAVARAAAALSPMTWLLVMSTRGAIRKPVPYWPPPRSMRATARARDGAALEIGDRHQVVAAEDALVDPLDLLGSAGLAEAVPEKLLAILLGLLRGKLARALVALPLAPRRWRAAAVAGSTWRMSERFVPIAIRRPSEVRSAAIQIYNCSQSKLRLNDGKRVRFNRFAGHC